LSWAGISAVQVLAQTDRTRLASLVRAIVAAGNPAWLYEFEKDAASFIDHADPAIEFAFHVHGYDAANKWNGHSVGHLHMHCMVGIRTSREQEEKNVSLEEVYKAL
jgi:hypothetical protein